MAVPTFRVLLVDDEADIRSSLREVLEAKIPRLDVTEAEDGQAGLTALEAEEFDLIVTDYRMPGMDGMTFIKEADRVRPGIKSVMITAYPDPKLREEAEGYVEAFIPKPIDPIAFVDDLKRLLTHAARP